MATDNQNITFKGNSINISGESLKLDQKAPDFTLSNSSLEAVKLSNYNDKVLVLSVMPSIDTAVCATQTKKFNQEASNLSDQVKILTVSLDLPFALGRFCGAEGIKNVETLSDYKDKNFAENYACFISDLGILTRAVFVLDKDKNIKHIEYVSEVTDEPDYDKALEVVKNLI
ncbi:UNVERIFIED_CONTAM: hypothetical protein GTU68_041338 [Idotea baltica]|nr:hypothetical protein [Idotea baltica]